MGRRSAEGRVDLGAMKKAVAGFLRAAGVDPSSRDLRQTPDLVARAWRDEFLAGYRMSAAEVLSDRVQRNGKAVDLVVLDRIDYVSMCPHHLLPSKGVACVAYAPRGWLIGLGQIARLVDVFAHRLVLQEDLARQIAEALVEELGARGAACILEAEHACLQTRGERRSRAATRTEVFIGTLARNSRFRKRLLQRSDWRHVR
jgi:GTP cyclohydrolase I